MALKIQMFSDQKFLSTGKSTKRVYCFIDANRYASLKEAIFNNIHDLLVFIAKVKSVDKNNNSDSNNDDNNNNNNKNNYNNSVSISLLPTWFVTIFKSNFYTGKIKAATY